MSTDCQREQVCKWLQQTNPSPLHNQACNQYEPGTGDWVLKSQYWKPWLEGKQRSVWIHGIPGAGKTVLISYLIEQIRLHCDDASAAKRAYVYYYCYFGHHQDEAVPFLRWLMAQLCRQAKLIPREIYEIYKCGVEPTMRSLLEAISELLLSNFDVAYVVVDAIDESSPRSNLLALLKELGTHKKLVKLQLLSSSREYVDIRRVMQEFSEPVSMANPFVENDIKVYVRSTLRSNPKMKRWPQTLQKEVEETLSTRARGMFRWAVCQIDILQRLKPESQIIENALKNLPKTLNETYDRIFLSIPEDDHPFVRHALRWIYFHDEIQEGNIDCSVLLQAVAKSATKDGSYHNDYLYDEETLHELCGCLIRINQDSVQRCGGTPYVSFAHYTVREYLDSARILEGPTAYFMADKDLILALSTEIIFSEALRFERDVKRHSNGRAINAATVLKIANDFDIYCVKVSLNVLSIIPRHISRHESLRLLATKLLGSGDPPFDLLWDVATEIMHRSDSSELWCFPLFDWDASGDVWDIFLAPFGTTATARLLHLLIFSKHCNELALLENFLRSSQAKRALESFLSCSKSTDTTTELDGNIIQIYAQVKYRHLSQFKLLLEYGIGLYDPNEILLLLIELHNHVSEVDVDGYCPLEHLLELGGDPNGGGYQVNPLQVAAMFRNYDGVEILLTAGADPNGIGSINGEGDDAFRHFNHLRGRSPLYICKTSRSLQGDPEETQKEVSEAIERILRRYGAKLQPNELEELATQE